MFRLICRELLFPLCTLIRVTLSVRSQISYYPFLRVYPSPYLQHYQNDKPRSLLKEYYVDAVGRNKKVIAEYIRTQLEEDFALDQISIKEYMAPFTGSKNSKA